MKDIYELEKEKNLVQGELNTLWKDYDAVMAEIIELKEEIAVLEGKLEGIKNIID